MCQSTSYARYRCLAIAANTNEPMHVDHQNHLNRICIIIHASTHLYAQVNIHAGRVTEESATEERENVKKRKMSRRPVEGKQIAEEREARRGREE